MLRGLHDRVRRVAPHSSAWTTPQPCGSSPSRPRRSGLDSVWAADHIVLPTSHTSTYPYSADGLQFLIAPGLPFLDQFTTLAWVAGFTSRVKLGTAVTLLPLNATRSPQAKTTATLDVLSGGRSILGVAAGWLREEFDALGLDFDRRGAVLDESLRLVRAAWTEQEVQLEGRFFNVRGVESYPHPAQMPHPPIWVGGQHEGRSCAAPRGTATRGSRRCSPRRPKRSRRPIEP